MKMNARLIRWSFFSVTFAATAILLAGCKSSNSSGSQKPETAATPAATAPAVTPAPAAAPATAATTGIKFPLRIKAGSSTPVTDAAGNTWLPEQGFADGDTTERPDLQIENTKMPEIYRSEHYKIGRAHV